MSDNNDLCLLEINREKIMERKIWQTRHAPKKSPKFVLFKTYSRIILLLSNRIFIFASSASLRTDAPCLLAGFAPNPPRTSFHSEPHANKIALKACRFNVPVAAFLISC